jgi:hypothetical protein
MALDATLSARKFILLWERHLAAMLSWLEAIPKKLNLLESQRRNACITARALKSPARMFLFYLTLKT